MTETHPAAKHVVALSFGKDSTALALRLAEVEPRDYVYLCTPTGNELPDLEDHAARIERLLGQPIVRLKPFGDVDGLVHLIRSRRMIPNFRMRWCTPESKILPTIRFLTENAPAVQYVGLRADEPDREGIYGVIPGVSQRYPFREWGWGVEEVWGYLAERGVKIPRRTDCAFCYGQRLIEWKMLLELHPDVYALGEELEAETGHTFRSPGRDTWPAGLRGLRLAFESGRRLRGEEAARRRLEMYEHGEGGEQPCRVCSL